MLSICPIDPIYGYGENELCEREWYLGVSEMLILVSVVCSLKPGKGVTGWQVWALQSKNGKFNCLPQVKEDIYLLYQTIYENNCDGAHNRKNSLIVL